MTYKMKLTKSVYALIGLVICITIASIVMNILILCEAGKLTGGNKPITAVSLVCSILLFGVCITLFVNTKYTLKDDVLAVYFGIMSIKFPYTSILATAVEKLSQKLFLQYSAPEKKGGFGVMQINISATQIDNFVEELKKHNPEIKSLNTSEDSDEK